ncbi:MAG: M42 family metallopeptidase [Opitutales bacterium]
MPKKTARSKVPSFLVDLLNARSPSGYEDEARAVVGRRVKPATESYQVDALGNCHAIIGSKGTPTLMMAGHIDELGLIIKHVDDKGFLYFDVIGGHDRALISGRRVFILTRKGTVKGVTGKRAIHLMSPEDRKKIPQLHQMWIDIGAKDKKEALSRIRIGDPAVYDHGFEQLHGSLAIARAFDDKTGAYAVNEALLRLAKGRKPTARVVAVSTSQEEIGVRGAATSAYLANPDVALVVDVSHATDHPDADHRKYGAFTLGGGPILTRGANVHPAVFERLVDCAEDEDIAVQIEADPRPTGTDARAIQVARAGVPTGIVGIPLRYMHTPSEVIDLEDLEDVVRLLVAFARSLKKGETFA